MLERERERERLHRLASSSAEELPSSSTDQDVPLVALSIDRPTSLTYSLLIFQPRSKGKKEGGAGGCCRSFLFARRAAAGSSARLIAGVFFQRGGKQDGGTRSSSVVHEPRGHAGPSVPDGKELAKLPEPTLSNAALLVARQGIKRLKQPLC